MKTMFLRAGLLAALFFCLPSLAQHNETPLRFLPGQKSPLTTQARVSVVVFTSPTCPICEQYKTRLEALEKRNPRVQFVTLTTAADKKKTMNAVIAKLLDARVTPEAFVIADGKLVYRGRIDNDADGHPTRSDLADALAAALAHKPVARPLTRAFGCAI